MLKDVIQASLQEIDVELSTDHMNDLVDTIITDLGSYDLGLNALARKVQAANEKWWVDIDTGLPKERNVGEMLMLTVTELAEACEGHRKSLMDDKLPQYHMFDVEIVDCIIRCLDLARLMKNPIQEIYDAKMAYNAVRPDHKLENRRLEHGKKY